MSNITPFKACPGFVLVDPIEQYQSKGAIKIADSVNDPESQRLGLVLSVGEEGISRAGLPVPQPCKVGDTIVHRQYHYDNFKHNNHPYKFVSFEDVYAVLIDVK